MRGMWECWNEAIRECLNEGMNGNKWNVWMRECGNEGMIGNEEMRESGNVWMWESGNE